MQIEDKAKKVYFRAGYPKKLDDLDNAIDNLVSKEGWKQA